jgi:hypothetical protein
MATIKLHRDYLLEELGLPDSAIKNTITSTSRWSENHEIIFAHDGKFYRTYYSCGLTEYQDESPWEYEEEVECTEVELKEKLVKLWENK